MQDVLLVSDYLSDFIEPVVSMMLDMDLDVMDGRYHGCVMRDDGRHESAEDQDCCEHYFLQKFVVVELMSRVLPQCH